MTDDILPRRLVSYRDGEKAAEMEVYLDLDIEGRTYALLVPADMELHVVRASFEDEDSPQFEKLADGELAGLQKNLDDAFKAWKLKTRIEDNRIYLVGEPTEDFYDDYPIVQVKDEDNEEEDYAVVLELDDGHNHYAVLTIVYPEFTPVELDGDTARRLTDDELLALEETFNEAAIALQLAMDMEDEEP